MCEQNHRAPGPYTVSDTYVIVHKDDLKFKTQSRQKTQKTQEDESVVFPKEHI